jgi:hypothetical protein
VRGPSGIREGMLWMCVSRGRVRARPGGPEEINPDSEISDEGLHNGLYWKATAGEPLSPMGPLVASAVAEGYHKDQAGTPTPFHGYYYRILTQQGNRPRAVEKIMS